MFGVMLAVRARTTSNAYVRFLGDADKFGKSEISWDELGTRSSATLGATLIIVLALATFVCLIIGAGAGVLTVWSRK